MVQVGSHTNARPQRRTIRGSWRTYFLVAMATLMSTWAYLLHWAHTSTSSTTTSTSVHPPKKSSTTTIRTHPQQQDRDTAAAASPSSTSSTTATTIAYAVSVTGCGSDPITEGAAVLKHSIHRVHHGHGKYDYRMFALYHPDAAACARPLQDLGYTVLQRDVFVNVQTDIQGDFLRSKIQSNGCCGEKELIKLEAYTLTDFPIVVHLDLDVLVLQPLDDLFDAMLLSEQENHNHQQPQQWNKQAWMHPDQAVPNRINAFYTYDYNMVQPRVPYKPVQGGFLVTRPSLEVYEEFKTIVRVGDFRKGSGWGGKVGPFHGSMTFQGLIPYYYDVLHPGQAVELNRCVYNQMADNPRTGRTVNDVVSGDCRTGESDHCEDCRSRPLEDVVTTHFTLCQKPWWCLPHTQDAIQHRLCRKLTREWYRIRSELEQSWGRTGTGDGSYQTDQFFGYCRKQGKDGYLKIAAPYGGH